MEILHLICQVKTPTSMGITMYSLIRIFVVHMKKGKLNAICYPLRERLRTHKVFTKYQCFYLNYHKFSIKSYVLDVY